MEEIKLKQMLYDMIASIEYNDHLIELSKI